jgi:hypothetical protein
MSLKPLTTKKDNRKVHLERTQKNIGECGFTWVNTTKDTRKVTCKLCKKIIEEA